MALPLEGIRVLDITNVLAGPFCTYQLGMMGAEVIKIEQPGRGDLARNLGADPVAAARGMGASFVAVNCGKQSVTLDLKNAEGKELLKRFVVESDVLVENYRPGVMERLGLGHEVLRKIKPSLVYCAISGFGQDGPFAQRPAYDQIVQGASGIMSITGDAESAPLRVGYPVADTVGGMTAAFAVVSALFGAKETGIGRFIDVSMLESTLATMGWVVSNYLNAGVTPLPMGNANFTAAPSGTFRTGQGLINISANEDRQFFALCDVLETPALKNDARFAARQDRKEHRAALTAQLELALEARGAAEWEELLISAGVPAGQVLSVPEILNHGQITERGFIHEFVTPGGSQQVTRGGFKFDDVPLKPLGAAPALSADTTSWLQRFGYDEEQISRLKVEKII
jgi:crotonobetainyl-CoA:carnitine CoA-transferase CaiB-like acyl-CoA transferase